MFCMIVAWTNIIEKHRAEVEPLPLYTVCMLWKLLLIVNTPLMHWILTLKLFFINSGHFCCL